MYENPTWSACEAQTGSWCSDADVISAFFKAAAKQTEFVGTAALNVNLNFVKVLKFFQNSGRMKVIFRSLAGGAADISWFFMLFGVIFFGFTLQGYILFGSHNVNFVSVSSSVLEVYEMILGNYGYDVLSRADATMAPFFFFPFLLLFYYLLMNVFFAIMDKNFQHFDHEYDKERDDMQVMSARSGGSETERGGATTRSDGEAVSARVVHSGRGHHHGHGHSSTAGDHSQHFPTKFSRSMGSTRTSVFKSIFSLLIILICFIL